MAGIPLDFGATGGTGPPATRMSFFVKTNTVLTHQTTLVDIKASTIGYLRVFFDPSLNFVLEAAYRGNTAHVVLTPTGFVFQSNHWYWISVIEGGYLGSGSGWKWVVSGQVWNQDGTTPGHNFTVLDISATAGLPPAGHEVVDCDLGWGVTLSSAYNPFPKALGDEMTELVIESSGTTMWTWSGASDQTLGVPTGPIAVASLPMLVALYHCDETVGDNETIHDATSGHYDLVPGGPNGNSIIADSPF